MESSKLISHIEVPISFDAKLQQIKERIINSGNKDKLKINEQLKILESLSEFEFGRHILLNQGVNGYWTHYMLTHPWRRRENEHENAKLTPMESFLLNRAPTMLATQQRFEIFLNENQKMVKSNSKLACIPSGMMGELLYLDFTSSHDIHLIGIDYDINALSDAKKLADKQQLQNNITLLKKDAWDLSIEEEYDLISSNGLNIYADSLEKVTELYRLFYNALKYGGKLVTSFLTYPPSFRDQCEWDFSKINPEDLLLQKNIFVDIIDTKFNCYCSSKEIMAQLESVGFTNIEFIYDAAKMFPTVVAYKNTKNFNS